MSWVVVVVGCSAGEGNSEGGQPDATSSQVQVDPCLNVGDSACLAGGLADVTFDGSSWRLIGTTMRIQPGPPTTSPVDRLISLQRNGTGCKQFAIDGSSTYYVDDTAIGINRPKEGTGSVRDYEYRLTICKRASDGAIIYRAFSDGWQMNHQYSVRDEGVLTQVPQ